jgi:hypothetical protein
MLIAHGKLKGQMKDINCRSYLTMGTNLPLVLVMNPKESLHSISRKSELSFCLVFRGIPVLNLYIWL